MEKNFEDKVKEWEEYAALDAKNDLFNEQTMLKLLKESLEKTVSNMESFIDKMSNSDKMSLYALYAEKEQSDVVVYHMYDADMIFGKLYPSELFAQIDTDFNYEDEYFWSQDGKYISGNAEDFLSYAFYASDIVSWMERFGYDSKELNDIKPLQPYLKEIIEVQKKISDSEELIAELS